MPGRRWMWWPLVVIAAAQLMVVMDATVLTVALPSAQRALGMSDAARAWVITAFTLTRAGLVLVGGRLADRFGHRRLLILGIAGFGVSSAVAAAAPTAWVLLGGRGLQGACGAILVASTRSLLVSIYTDERVRARALGVFAAVLTGGMALGFVASGLLTEFAGWRWSLYINVPLAALALAGSLLVLPNPAGHPESRVDVPSALLAFGVMAALVYGFGDADAADRTLVLLLGAAALLILFLARQARMNHPLLPLRIVADHGRGGALIAMAVGAFGTFGMMLTLTYQLQTVMHDTPLTTGLALLPFAVAGALGSAVLAPRWLARLPPSRVVPPGLAVAGVGLVVLSRHGGPVPALAVILVATLLVGVGSGVVSASSLQAALRGVARADVGVVAALTSMAPQLGGSAGTVLLNTIAVAATASYLGAGRAPHAATAHGLAVASVCGGVTELAAALVLWFRTLAGRSGRAA